MEISVVIPMYNNEDTIIDALNSIKFQTRLDLIKEVIVVDDGSIDNSYNLVYNYIQNNKSIFNIEIIRQKNSGASSARNVGMLRTNGDWIALLDADDVWLPTKIEEQYYCILNNANIDFLGCGYNDTNLRILHRKINKLYKATLKDLCIKMFPVTPSVIFKREIFENIGGFDEDFHYAEDGNYFMKICMKYNYYYLPKNLVLIGHGKHTFGDKGLSANLKGMYLGNIKTIKSLRKNKEITCLFYLFLKIFYYVKYIRRIILTKLRRKK